MWSVVRHENVAWEDLLKSHCHCLWMWFWMWIIEMVGAWYLKRMDLRYGNSKTWEQRQDSFRRIVLWLLRSKWIEMWITGKQCNVELQREDERKILFSNVLVELYETKWLLWLDWMKFRASHYIPNVQHIWVTFFATKLVKFWNNLEQSKRFVLGKITRQVSDMISVKLYTILTCQRSHVVISLFEM